VAYLVYFVLGLVLDGLSCVYSRSIFENRRDVTIATSLSISIFAECATLDIAARFPMWSLGKAAAVLVYALGGGLGIWLAYRVRLRKK
jgi:hypothetical protein